ncbi:hypothetical protein [Microcoleus sp. FACHB-68]|uniref:hypothetical protein n=1 Tax=Microcoleus sp. FACHB-68 TaxID=2692826 RepID=UPI001A7E95DB|nr:hypothetical protein [Microcoleus sp. FACHB-68]
MATTLKPHAGNALRGCIEPDKLSTLQNARGSLYLEAIGEVQPAIKLHPVDDE